MATGRNDPCPCGSGKKYKKCCLSIGLEGATKASAAPLADDFARAAKWRDLDVATLHMLAEVGKGFDDWQPASQFPANAEDPDMAALFGPWAVYEHRDGRGQSIGDYFVRTTTKPLSREERLLLKAQSQARLSIWELVEVDPGHSVRVRDLLRADHERVLTEKQGSEHMKAGQSILARVLDLDGISLLGGLHPVALAEAGHRAADVVREGLMGKGDRPLDDDTLRRPDFSNLLIEVWESIVRQGGNEADATP